MREDSAIQVSLKKGGFLIPDRAVSSPHKLPRHRGILPIPGVVPVTYPSSLHRGQDVSETGSEVKKAGPSARVLPYPVIFSNY